MPQQRVQYGGQIHEFPADFKDEDIAAALEQIDAEQQFSNVQSGSTTKYAQPSAGTRLVEGVKRGAQNVAHAVANPIETLGSLTQQYHPIDQLEHGYDMEKARGGTGLSPALHGVINAVPLVGPMLEERMVKANEDLAGMIGETGTEIAAAEAGGAGVKAARAPVARAANAGVDAVARATDRGYGFEHLDKAAKLREAADFKRTIPMNRFGMVAAGVKEGVNLVNRARAALHERVGNAQTAGTRGRMSNAYDASLEAARNEPSPVPQQQAAQQPMQQSVLDMDNQAYLDNLRSEARARMQYENAYNQSQVPVEETVPVQQPQGPVGPAPTNMINDQFMEQLRQEQGVNQRYADAYQQNLDAGLLDQEVPVQQQQAPAGPAPVNAINEDFMRSLREQPAAAAPEAAAMPLVDDSVQMYNQIRPTGSESQTFVARHAKDAYEIMPELRNVPMGEGFRLRATNAFKNFETTMKAVEKSIPDDTIVPKDALMKDILPVEAEAAVHWRPGTPKPELLKTLEVLNDFPPNIKWKDFLEVKKKIRAANSFGSDPFMRKAYKAFMNAADRVSPELQKANKNFSTNMRVLEAAHIDPVSGQWLKMPTQR